MKLNILSEKLCEQVLSKLKSETAPKLLKNSELEPKQILVRRAWRTLIRVNRHEYVP
jgi:hypothetical protein